MCAITVFTVHVAYSVSVYDEHDGLEKSETTCIYLSDAILTKPVRSNIPDCRTEISKKMNTPNSP